MNIANSWRPGTTLITSAGGGGGSIVGTLSGMIGATTIVTVPSVESVLSMQKRGAERLFQYMEADGSDPEDYAR